MNYAGSPLPSDRQPASQPRSLLCILSSYTSHVKHGRLTLQKVTYNAVAAKTHADPVSIASSPPFTFVVGPEHKEYTIHSALVAQQSPVLNALVNGQMKEAIERRVIWEDIDEETFIRFSQFAYTGDYDKKDPKKRKAETETVIPVQAGIISHIDEGTGWPGGINGPIGYRFQHPPTCKKDQLWTKFQNLYQTKPNGSARVNGPRDDYADVFRCHAHVYIFADRYGIQALQTMALQKLAQALYFLNLDVRGCGDIARLVRLCFDVDDDRGHLDALRSLVCCYAACKLEDLWKYAEFRELTAELPEFPASLMTQVLERLD